MIQIQHVTHIRFAQIFQLVYGVNFHRLQEEEVSYDPALYDGSR